MKQQAIDILDEMIEEANNPWNKWESKHKTALKEAKSRIQALWDGWIPVTERLPDFTWEVFTYRNNNIAKWFFVSSWPEKPHFFEDYVTHWMPLPLPPNK